MTKITKFIIVLFFFLSPVNINALEFSTTATNIILYNLNDFTILYEQNSDEKTNIASLTKIMTALVGIEIVEDYDLFVTITSSDFVGTSGYSKAGFAVGDTVTYRDLFYGILLPSGADAVNALVNNTLGYEDFIAKMNEKAKEIGLENTSFSNPVGKDDVDNYSTASDIAKLLQYALSNPLFEEIFTTKEYTTTNGLVLESTLYSYKDILDTDLIIGSKSGFTQGAGRCLASITTLNDVNYLLVVINSTTEQNYSAVLDSLTIYEYYDSNYSYQQVLSTDNVIATIPIKWSTQETYNITVSEEILLYLKNDTASNLNIDYDGVDVIEGYTKKGTKLGIVTISDGDNILYTTEVYLDDDINYYNLYLIGIIVLVLFLVSIFIIKRICRRRRRRRKKG